MSAARSGTLAALVLAGACLQGDPEPAAPATGAAIVFCSDRDGGVYRLYRMAADGSDVRPLLPVEPDVRPLAEHRNPCVSADGQRLVFERIAGGRSDLSLLALDGSGTVRSITDSGSDSQPSWSPDGKRIAFRSTRDGDSAIFVRAVDGGAVQRLSPPGAFDRWPRWAPVGDRIAFCSVENGDEDLWLMATDGGDRRRLLEQAGAESRPSWSLDGEWLVFHATAIASAKHEQIYRIGAEGGGLALLHGGAEIREQYMDRNTASWGPVVAPDGGTVLFVSTRTGNAEVYAMRGDGSAVRRITRNSGQDDMATWWPQP